MLQSVLLTASDIAKFVRCNKDFDRNRADMPFNSVFAVDEDSNLKHKYFDGSAWQPAETDWELLSSEVALDQSVPPAACSWAPTRMDVFARGKDDCLYHKYYDGSSWNPETGGIESLGCDQDSGKLRSGIASVSWVSEIA